MGNYEDQKRAMNLSLAAAVVPLGAKVTAAVFTGWSTVYSDAAESVVHLLAVGFAARALRLAYRPANETHHFGHDNVTFLSVGFDGAMISAAAVFNLVLGLVLIKIGKKVTRHRRSGRTHWVEFHLVFDDFLTVGQAHEAATEIEASVADLLKPDGRVISHLEPRSAEHRAERWKER